MLHSTWLSVSFIIARNKSDTKQFLQLLYVLLIFISYLVLRNKPPQDLEVQIHKCLLSHGFCGLGIWDWLAG